MTDTSFEEAQREALTLSSESAEFLMARLDALTQAARVFGSGLSGVDVHIGWSLGGADEEIRWIDAESGRPRVRVQLDLSHVVELLRSNARDDPGAEYLDAFKTGFLHELGHILYSGRSLCTFTDPEQDPLACVALDEEQAALAAVPGVREVLRQICLTLEDARVERRLMGAFRGARRFLEPHAEQALAIAHGHGPGDGVSGRGGGAASAQSIERLVALLFLQVWGLEGRTDKARIPAEVSEAAERLGDSLEQAVSGADPLDLAAWVGGRMMPEIRDYLLEIVASDSAASGSVTARSKIEDGAPNTDELNAAGPTYSRETAAGAPAGPEDEAAVDLRGATRGGTLAGRSSAALEKSGSLLPTLSREIERRFAAPELLLSGARGHRLARAGGENDADQLDSSIIVFPHVDGRMVLDELPSADALKVRPSDSAIGVARDVLQIYGPMALAAFAGEAAALRRAFQVNHERRLSGRHRSGKRVGVSNVRRFVTSDDLRLFQKMEVPDRLSYYFHLLVDVSPSMLTNKNAQKAVATAYAFAEALDRLRVPVDVTLYSSAVTVLHDHRVDTLRRFFGGDFGYLSSSTHEIEAIAYAKQKADTVTEDRKFIVVVTDGEPNSVALRRAGATDLKSYYHTTLIPWLERGGVDLMAIGIGISPSYHRHSVSVSSSWESIGVLMRLLDDIIARGARSHSALWA